MRAMRNTYKQEYSMHLFKFYIGVQLINKVLVSGVQQSDSVIYIHIHTHTHTHTHTHARIYSFSNSFPV